MIKKNDLIQYIIEIEPEFSPYLIQYRNENYSEEDKPSVGEEFTEFTHFVCNKFESGSYPNAKAVFKAIEFLLEDGNSDDYVQTLATTYFLEGIQNTSSHGTFSPSLFVPLLGPKSREYCRAWDEFMGGDKTPGLWDN